MENKKTVTFTDVKIKTRYHFATKRGEYETEARVVREIVLRMG